MTNEKNPCFVFSNYVKSEVIFIKDKMENPRHVLFQNCNTP